MKAVRSAGKLPLALASILVVAGAASSSPSQLTEKSRTLTFDRYWEQLDRHYDYFELNGVDWKAARERHRERAIRATAHAEFLHELARLFCPLRDPHLSLQPPFGLLKDHAVAKLQVIEAESKLFVGRWPAGYEPSAPPEFRSDARAFPEIVSVNGAGICPSLLPTLLFGRKDTTLPIVVEWPDGSRTTEDLPITGGTPLAIGIGDEDDWLEHRIVGNIGYVAIRNFELPRRKSRGGGIQARVRDRIAEIDTTFDALKGTSRLIVDLRDNGGGVGQLATEVLAHLIDRRVSLATRGGDYGLEPVVSPRQKRFVGEIVAIVNEQTASAGEITAAFLRRFAGAHIVGGRTVGAEAPLSFVEGLDGSLLTVGFGSFDSEKKPSYQSQGLQPDTVLELTAERLRRDGLRKAWIDVERQRFERALALLDVDDPASHAAAAIQDAYEARLVASLDAMDEPGKGRREAWDEFIQVVERKLEARSESCPSFLREIEEQGRLVTCVIVGVPFKDFKKQWNALAGSHEDLLLQARSGWKADDSGWRTRTYSMKGRLLSVRYSEPNQGVALIYR